MGMFTKESLEKLKEKVDLELVCKVLNLTVQGDVTSFTCPFCDGESFVLDLDFERYYCFDCKAKGDAISLLMSSRNQTYVEAVKFLSIMFNQKVEEVKGEKKKEILSTIIKGNSFSYEEVLNLIKKYDDVEYLKSE